MESSLKFTFINVYYVEELHSSHYDKIYFYTEVEAEQYLATKLTDRANSRLATNKSGRQYLAGIGQTKAIVFEDDSAYLLGDIINITDQRSKIEDSEVLKGFLYKSEYIESKSKTFGFASNKSS